MLHSWNSICLITCNGCDATIVLQPYSRPLGYTQQINDKFIIYILCSDASSKKILAQQLRKETILES